MSGSAQGVKWARREVFYTLIGMVATAIAYLMLSLDVQSVLAERLRAGYLWPIAEQICFVLIIYFIIYGNLVYHFARLGHWKRQGTHRAAPRTEIEAIHDFEYPPSLTVLVPSYKEEEPVVCQTLLSAALMEYPGRRVVLLIDDPPHPERREDAEQLERMRGLPARILAMLSAPAQRFESALHAYERRQCSAVNPGHETRRLGKCYLEAAIWLEKMAAGFEVKDHTDNLFVELILIAPARAHRERASKLMRRSRQGAAALSPAELLREYRRLAALFAVEISTFERKQFANLSHAPNKAMNLNSYIGLIDGHFRATSDSAGQRLEPCAPDCAELAVAPADYLITLDADSLLLGDYALRLIYEMERRENRRVAVVQTPYSAVPGASSLIERIAGATTDVQHIIHQGFTWMRATYWVGANALLRHAALKDIRVIEDEDGKPVAKYIQDRTVIEDTESSIDLVLRGWRLHNYPERLAYSATPADFGSLLIQRRRWANGGLIIMPKLLRYLGQGPGRMRRLGEGFMRLHYLTSLAGVSLGMLILILHPFDRSMHTWWLPMTALPYFALYGRDLVTSGYKWRDLPRVYALNLLLIPINLGGVTKSLHQACTGRRSAFGRTPKIAGRTAAPQFYVVVEFAILLYCLLRGVDDLLTARWLHAAFALINGALLAYAVGCYVGFREAAEDAGLLRPREALQSMLASAGGLKPPVGSELTL